MSQHCIKSGVKFSYPISFQTRNTECHDILNKLLDVLDYKPVHFAYNLNLADSFWRNFLFYQEGDFGDIDRYVCIVTY